MLKESFLNTKDQTICLWVIKEPYSDGGYVLRALTMTQEDAKDWIFKNAENDETEYILEMVPIVGELHKAVNGYLILRSDLETYQA